MVHKLVNIEPKNSYTNHIFILLFFFFSCLDFFLVLCYAQFFGNSLMIHISLSFFFFNLKIYIVKKTSE